MRLRPVEPGDAEVVSRLRTDPAVRKYLGGPVAADEAARRTRAVVGAATIYSAVRR